MSNEPATVPALPSTPSHGSRIHGCLLGGALGDTLGFAVETASDGGSHFSDGTQLTLYTVDGLLEALEWANDGVAADTTACLWLAYLRWLATQGVPVPDAAPFQPPRWIDSHDVLRHRRAPESACLSGLATGEMGTFYRPVNPEAKGCGAVMRSAPFGLIPFIAADAVYKLSADAASLTHGHPAARQSAGAFSLVIHALASGHNLRDAAEFAVRQLDGASGGGAGPDGARLRTDEMVDPGLTARLEAALRLGVAGSAPGPGDLAGELGEGRTAEEALAVALFAVLSTAPENTAPGTPDAHFRAAIDVAVNHGGDSGSAASMTGNILGTFYGEDCLPAEWLAVLEAPELVRGMASRLAAVTGS
ncbi:ADP-ribosylglycohydrolase family protein [Pseudarthrobacter sp. 1C304]|uniref:ADP-ribosylglycohydrolase family protein n=1 Tax=Pseudarthrobacter sp. 1C304 TaxID=3457438 RepID=UPI003FD5EFD8